MVRHQGGSNLLLADGHAKWYRFPDIHATPRSGTAIGGVAPSGWPFGDCKNEVNASYGPYWVNPTSNTGGIFLRQTCGPGNVPF